MKLGDLLNKLAIQSGTNAEDDNLKALLSSPSVMSLDVHDEIATKIQNSLLTPEAAAANPKIKTALFTQALNGADAKLDALAEKHGLQDKWNEIKATEKNTYQKIELFSDLLHNEVKTKSTETLTGDKKKLADDITKLNGDIVSIKSLYEKKINDINTERSHDKINWEMNSIYSGINYSMEEQLKMPKVACITTAKTFVQDKMNTQGLKIVTDENGNIQLRTNEDTPHFEQNKQVTVSDYVQKTLADNNFLKVTEAKPKTPFKPTFQMNGNGNGNGQAANASAALSALDSLSAEAAKDLA